MAVREKTALLLAGRRALRRILSRVQLVRARRGARSRVEERVNEHNTRVRSLNEK